MPSKITAGISKKIGQPGYGSLATSCQVEIELDDKCSIENITAFKERATQVFNACREAVEDELARHGQSPVAGEHVDHNGNSEHPVTERQVNYIEQLAGQMQGLGSARLGKLSERMFGRQVESLTSKQASGLIDSLKAVKEDRLGLDHLLNGAVQG